MANHIDGYWWSNDGLRLHYREYEGPDGRPPIICLPGLTRNARDFEELANHLAGEWRVICVDFRGRGDSAYAKDPMTYVPLTYVQDVEALLTELSIERFVSIGTSLGGIVTMLLASTRQGRLAGAVLNDIGPEIDPAGLKRIQEYVGQGRSYMTWVHAARALQEVGQPIYPNFTLTDWITSAKRSHKLTRGGKIILDYDMKISDPFKVPGGEAGVDLWPALNGLKEVPTSLLRGQLSDILSEATAKKMCELSNEMKLTTVKNVGHAPTLDEPDARAAIDALLTKIKTEKR